MPEPAVLECPECKVAGKQTTFEGEMAAMRRGAHRRRAHDVKGTAPKPVARRKDRAPRPKAPRGPSLAGDLQTTFKTIGTVVGVVDPYCGGVLVNHSAAFCRALARLAQEDPRVRRVLAALGKAGPYGALLVAAGEMAIPIAAHHRLVAPEVTLFVGVKPPEPRPARSVPDSDGERERTFKGMAQ